MVSALKRMNFDKGAVRVELDSREMHGGEKRWSWIKRGVPIIVEIGPRDVKNNSVFVERRDRGRDERKGEPVQEFINRIGEMLSEIQEELFVRAKHYRDENLVTINDKEDFFSYFKPMNAESPEIHGGFAVAHWCGQREMEEEIAKEHGVTIRNIPFDLAGEEGKCIFTGLPSKQRVLFAKSY